MQSIREQIIQKIVAKLTPVATLQGATIQRQPTIPTDRSRLPALLVFPEMEAVQRINERSERELALRIVALACGTVVEEPEPIADRLLAAAHSVLMTYRNLDGLAQSLEELDCEWQQDDADMALAAMPARYRITYRTLTHDLTQKG
ncbi:hypothetical protein [Nitrosomonas communis]|uniref:Uncharacterized protein n=1 Tax=Nitrosomonas communis TaxID=44574 RepID=A0A1I4LQH7_9PROT|nr:hypothetical protein [Nitrosomonas communis]SFL93215.1 hypothetical protein SAMN05421863_100748 [Nitrosomonas communis]